MLAPSMCSSTPSVPSALSCLKEERQGIQKVTEKFANDKFSTLLKAIYVYMDFAGGLFPAFLEIPGYKTTSLGARLGKLSKSPGAIIDKTAEAMLDCQAFWRNRTVQNGAKAVLSLNGIVTPFWEICDFLSRAVFYIPKQSIRMLKGVCGCSMILSFGHATLQTISKIFNWTLLPGSEKRGPDGKAINKGNFIQHFLKLVENVTYLGLGILTVAFIFGEIPIAEFTFGVFSMINVTSSILVYYWDNINTKCKKVALI